MIFFSERLIIATPPPKRARFLNYWLVMVDAESSINADGTGGLVQSDDSGCFGGTNFGQGGGYEQNPVEQLYPRGKREGGLLILIFDLSY